MKGRETNYQTLQKSQMDTDGIISSFQAPPRIPVLGVRRWKGKEQHTLYIFVGKETNIPVTTLEHIRSAERTKEWHSSLASLTGYKHRPADDIKFVFATVWPDDSVMYALVKILMMIKEVSKKPLRDVYPFAWNSKGILRFRWPSLAVDPDRLNPWEHPLDVVAKQPEYDSYALVGAEEIQLVIYEDIHGSLDKKQLAMYFPDAEYTTKLTPNKFIRITEDYLEDIWMSPLPNILQVTSRIKGVVFEASYKPMEMGVTIADLFERSKATKTTQLIQWSDDTMRVMYKLYKKHSIRSNDFARWTSSYHVPRVPSIVFYDILQGTGTSIRVQIQEDGKIYVAYNIDPVARGKESLQTIEEIGSHAKNITEGIKTMLGLDSLSLKMADVSYDVVSSISTTGIDKERLFHDVQKALGEAVPLFFMVHRHTDKNKKTMIFRRASNLNYQFSLAETVQSMLDYGIHSEDVRSHLLELGYEKDQLNSAIEEVASAHEEGKAIRPSLNIDVEHVMVLTLVQVDGSLKYGIRHAPDTEEAKRALRWLSSIVSKAVYDLRIESVSVSISSEEGTPSPPELRAGPPAAPSVTSAEEQQAQAEVRAIEQKEEEEEVKSEESWEFGGGGKTSKKTGDGFLLERLQTADPIIFKNDKINYARGCQGDRQPLLMSKEEWERSKTKVANSILYRNNYYSCPSIWCREAGVVMTSEELKANKGLCPNSKEKPIILWDKPKERFVGFNKNIITENGKNIYSPCCFMADQFSGKKGKIYEDLVVYKSNGEPLDMAPEPPKEKVKKGEKLKESKGRKEDEETYILKPSVPISEGRYGSVPLALYRVFFPQSNEPSNNISIQPTIIRHGIGAHNEDSLMNSIAYALGYSSKKQLVEEFIKVLDPLTFISLEGGAVLEAFMNDSPPQLSYEAWRKWIDQYPAYKKLLEITDDDDQNDVCILRERKVYEAYLHFIEHLLSNDTKNTRMLYNIIARLGVLFMVWERDRSGEGVRLSCPYFMSYKDMKGLVKQFKNRYIMLLYHGSYKYPYYEPLEIRTLNKPSVREIPLDDYPEVEDVSLKCPVAYDEGAFIVLEKLRGLIYWTMNMFHFSYKQYMPESIVLSADLRIEGIITHGSIWIGLPRLSIEILPRLVEMLESIKLKPRLYYHEDVDIDTVTSMFYVVNHSEYEVWKQRCSSIGFRIMDIPPSPPPVVPTVPIMPSRYEKNFADTRKDAVKWRDNQLRIARYMLYQYDDKVRPHVGKPRKDFINEMIELVANDLLKKSKLAMQERKEVKTAVEEMPLIYGKESLKKWIHAITLTPYRFYDSGVHTVDGAKNNWTFSQLAVEVGLPVGVVTPSSAVVPIEDALPHMDDVYPIETLPAPPPPRELPRMAKPENISLEDMPTKWKKAKIVLMRVKRNRAENIPELAQWIASKVYSPFVWNDIVHTRYSQIIGFTGLPLKEFKEALGLVLQEPTFKRTLQDLLEINKTMKDEGVLSYMWSHRTELTEKINEMSAMEASPVWPMDMDLRIMAQLYDIFVLVMFRKPYSQGEHDKKETDIENMRLSSMLYFNQNTTMERPLVMLYRERDKDKPNMNPNVYSLIKSQTDGRFYYNSASDAPDEIRAIIDAHRQRSK